MEKRLAVRGSSEYAISTIEARKKEMEAIEKKKLEGKKKELKQRLSNKK